MSVCVLRVQVTNSSTGSDNSLVPTKRQAIIRTNDGLLCWRIYASLGLSELILETGVNIFRPELNEQKALTNVFIKQPLYAYWPNINDPNLSPYWLTLWFPVPCCPNRNNALSTMPLCSPRHARCPSQTHMTHAASWWRHQMETFSASLAIYAGNSPVTGEFPAQRPVTRSFGVFFDLRLNKRLSKQWWGWWFETPSCSLWRQCNVWTHHNKC